MLIGLARHWRSETKSLSFATLATSPVRSAELQASVPQAGLPELDYKTFFGAFAPVNMPKDRLEKLGREIASVVRSPSFISKYVTAGYDAVGNSPAEFKKALEKEMAGGRNLVAISGVKLSQ